MHRDELTRNHSKSLITSHLYTHSKMESAEQSG